MNASANGTRNRSQNRISTASDEQTPGQDQAAEIAAAPTMKGWASQMREADGDVGGEQHRQRDRRTDHAPTADEIFRQQPQTARQWRP